MIQKKYLLIILLFCSHFVGAQKTNGKMPDSLSNKSFDYLSQAVINNEKDSIKSRSYAQTWLLKAKFEKDYKQMYLAYKTVMYQADKKEHLLYADSILASAKHASDNVLIGSAYMTKATVYYGRKEHKKALDNFIIADEYISKTTDLYSIYKVKAAPQTVMNWSSPKRKQTIQAVEPSSVSEKTCSRHVQPV